MKLIKGFLILSLGVMLPAQNTVLNEETAAQLAEGRNTVAVLDFEGRGISQMEAATLTDRLMSEMVATDAVIMVERTQMKEILDEQGLQQAGCTSAECAAEVGALLGVQYMVSGSFGKLGSTFTVDAKMFSVESGQTTKSVSKTYKGEVDGLLPIIEIVAWELVGLQPPAETLARAGLGQAQVAEKVVKPKKVRKPMGRGMKVTLFMAALGGGGYYAYSAGLLDDILGLGPDQLPGPPEMPGN
ncbi:MAG: CsgG/HfaB family protein [Candidatus Neomarinimicrobiota bacterium]